MRPVWALEQSGISRPSHDWVTILDAVNATVISGPSPSGPAVEAWVAALQRGNSDAAWDLFLDRYRRLIFAAIQHYAQDHDDVMDLFARVCEALREDRLRRIRSYTDAPVHRAKFSTWLVTVVRHLTVDWFRNRDGRRRISAIAASMTPLRRRIFESIFLEHRSHVEAYELIHTRHAPTLSFREFLVELRSTYQAATQGRHRQVFRDLGHVPLRAEAAPIDPIGPSALEAREQNQIVERALAALPTDDRLIVELYVLEELPADAVAKVLGLANAKAVYNRVYRALAAVRERLERSGIQRDDL